MTDCISLLTDTVEIGGRGNTADLTSDEEINRQAFMKAVREKRDKMIADRDARFAEEKACWDRAEAERTALGLDQEQYHNLLLKRIKDKKKAARKHAGHELGAREFTLTYSPKWMSDDEARIEMRKSISKLIKYYQEDLVTLRAVGEVGSNGLSHIHCFYRLVNGLKITDKNFKRAWKHWNPSKPLGKGFEGGHHATVKENSDFLGYIDKDVDTAWFDITVPSVAN